MNLVVMCIVFVFGFGFFVFRFMILLLVVVDVLLLLGLFFCCKIMLWYCFGSLIVLFWSFLLWKYVVCELFLMFMLLVNWIKEYFVKYGCFIIVFCGCLERFYRVDRVVVVDMCWKYIGDCFGFIVVFVVYW